MHEPQLPPDDHRALASRLDLCHFQDEAPGMVFWHPRGWTLYRLLEDAARAHVVAGRLSRGPHAAAVAPPDLGDQRPLGRVRDAMFAVGSGTGEAALKPVSCPGHIQLVKRLAPSWRDLPIRIAEFGRVHRDEPSGTLHGLMRLRQFTQDDGHIFCADDQIADEVATVLPRAARVLSAVRLLRVSVALSLRPSNRLGDDAAWDRAEQMLRDVAAGLGHAGRDTTRRRRDLRPEARVRAARSPRSRVAVRHDPARLRDAGALRRPLRRRDRRPRRHVVMLHRALFGSIERFLGVLLEHHGAALPAWLAPEQIAVVPVAPRHRANARARARPAGGLRARVDRCRRHARPAHRDRASRRRAARRDRRRPRRRQRHHRDPSARRAAHVADRGGRRRAAPAMRGVTARGKRVTWCSFHV